MGLYGDLIRIYPKPYSIYLRGATGFVLLFLQGIWGAYPDPRRDLKIRSPRAPSTYMGITQRVHIYNHYRELGPKIPSIVWHFGA